MKMAVQNLVRHFGRTRAVDGVSFTLESGRVLGFVGPNGAGKTTTMRIMATLDEPTGGDILLDGLSLIEYPEEARRAVGYMPDSLPAHSDMTVWEYLDFFGRAYGLRGPALTKAVSQVEAFTGLGDLREKTLNALSKGMKQRVSLARALVHNPSILIMDEPAAGLDPRARIELRELIAALAENGKAIFISSHILSELSEICHDVVILELGRIVHAGSAAPAEPGATPQIAVVLRALGEPGDLQKTLLETPGVHEVHARAGLLHILLDGGPDEAAALLAALVTRGVRIVEFRPVHDKLEDLFMKVTRGAVA
jgi:ABC-2 type transport system ATP-binding protein